MTMPVSCGSRDAVTRNPLPGNDETGSVKLEILLKVMPFLTDDGKVSPVGSMSTETMGQIKEILEQRLYCAGYRGFDVKEERDVKLLVTIPFVAVPGKDEKDRLERMLTKRGLLEFKEQKQNGASKQAEWSTVMDGSQIDRSSVKLSTNKDIAAQEISFSFNEKGAKQFAELTARNTGRSIGIFLDGQLLVSPKVMEAIGDGKVMITGASYQMETDYQDWANYLKHPDLPMILRVEKTEVKGPRR